MADFKTAKEKNSKMSTENASETAPLRLTADELSIATGNPEKRTAVIDSRAVPVWTFSGKDADQSVAGTISRLPADCRGVKVEIVVAAAGGAEKYGLEDVYRLHLSQGAGKAPEDTCEEHMTPVRTALSAAPGLPRTIELESYCATAPDRPLTVRIERCPGDPADTCRCPTDLLLVRVTPVKAPAAPFIVEDAPGYNSWPMLQAIGPKLVCAYSRGRGHDIVESCRGVYARTSGDGGKTWSPETLISNAPDCGEVTIGKGLDADGAMLLWVRCWGAMRRHDLYRSADGVTFTRIATPVLDPMPMQITDIFPVPAVGLMALWFAGNYSDDGQNSWGTLTSSDNGATWKQRVIESGLPKSEWPTEPSAVCFGNGRIFAVARTECLENTTERAQFQLESEDCGATWTRSRTNIGDVALSTPSLVFDEATGLLSNYYFHRGRGVLKRRVVKLDRIIGNPLAWPEPEPVALGSTAFPDAGNVNASVIQNMHFLAYYSGTAPDTFVAVSAAAAPAGATGENAVPGKQD